MHPNTATNTSAIGQAQTQPAVRERLIRLDEVEQRTGLKKSTIYARMRLQPAQFPRCVAIGCRAVAWPESEIDAWVAARVATGGAA